MTLCSAWVLSACVASGSGAGSPAVTPSSAPGSPCNINVAVAGCWTSNGVALRVRCFAGQWVADGLCRSYEQCVLVVEANVVTASMCIGSPPGDVGDAGSSHAEVLSDGTTGSDLPVWVDALVLVDTATPTDALDDATGEQDEPEVAANDAFDADTSQADAEQEMSVPDIEAELPTPDITIDAAPELPPPDLATSPECGNASCEKGETPSSCPSDCKPLCGDGFCDPPELNSTCPKDCKIAQHPCDAACGKKAMAYGCFCDAACKANGDCCTASGGKGNNCAGSMCASCK